MPPRAAPDAPTWSEPPVGVAAPAAALTDPGLLLAKSWETFKVRALPLVGLYLLAGLMALVPLGIGAGIGAILSAATPGGILVGVAAGAAGALWGGGGGGLAAFFLAVANDALNVADALAAARPRAWPFAWILVIVAFLVTGGTLLLVVPGIAFAVWFTFAPFAFVEGAQGMAALQRSRALVAGHGWQVLVRLLIVGLLGAVLGSVPGLGFLLGIAFVPFQSIFMRHLFDELRGKKPGARPAGSAAGLFGPALLGYAVGGAAIVAIAASSGPGFASVMRTGLAVMRGDPEGAIGALAAGQPPTIGPPFDFAKGLGGWRGREPDGGKEWVLTVQRPDRIDLRASGEEFYTGRARAMWKLGVEEEGVPVLPGGGLFDLKVEESSDPEAAGKTMLGTWKFDGPDALQLCLGRPGGFQRTSEFPAGPDFLCVELAREGE
jgi:hypothetical protein